MKKKQWLILSILWIFLSAPAWPAADNELDTLPIGASPQRLDLAVLPVGQIMATTRGQEIDMPTLVRQNLDKDVFIIG
ncbi:MAG: hypothetical protein MUO31_01370, partial [Thermodesulfovibrionales bacterium]|nr:hypothetical protein [Thermodesulfovibrionales bacterium]